MQPIRQRVTVDFSYDVHFTEHLFQPTNRLLAETIGQPDAPDPKKVVAVVDDGLLPHYPQLLEQIADYAQAHGNVMTLTKAPVVVPGGEAAKNDPALVDRIHRVIYEAHLDRHAYVVAIGGGAVLDLAGYAAATAHRGIRLIRVPTTALAQNDSGVGVKNGINAFDTKNFLGTFAPPHAVLNDSTFLQTLDDRDWRAGIAEAIKVALEHIASSGDPFELGSSRPLDFGHWAAHKLEELTDYALRHGEAVAIGIALDCVYAHLEGRLEVDARDAILDLMDALGFDLYVPELDAYLDDPDHPRCLFQGLDAFREHLGGELTIMLIDTIGHGVNVHSVNRDLYREAVHRLRARCQERNPNLEISENAG